MATESSSLLTPPLADMIKTHRDQRFVTVPVSQSVFDGWNTGGYNTIIEHVARITKPLYTKFKDDFDMIAFILDNTVVPGNTHGKNMTVSNAIKGIGRPVYSDSALYGSAGRLKSHCTIWKRDGIEMGPFLHEICHNWANHALATEAIYTSLSHGDAEGKNAGGHWGFSGCGGQLGGFDQSTLQTNVDGKADKYSARIYQLKAFGMNDNRANSSLYSKFELYLMGLLPESELEPFDVFTGVSIDPADVAGGWNGKFHAKTRTTYNREKIVALLGKREPSFETSQKQLNVLVAVLTPAPSLSADVEASINSQLERMSRAGSDDVSWRNNFWEATGGRGTMSFDLSRSAI